MGSTGLKVAVTVLGCKTNQYDAQALCEEFQRQGFSVVDFSDTADAYVIASCAVTREAAAKSRRAARRARRSSPAAVVAVLGCYPQSVIAAEQEEERRLLDEIPVDLLAGVTTLQEVVSTVTDLLRGCRSEGPAILQLCPGEEVPYGPPGISEFPDRARAVVKVQDGCDEFCSYCVIPYVRGPLRSRPGNEILEEVRRLLDAGYREIVLTGIHLGAYCRGAGADVPLTQLVQDLTAVDGDWRLRLSSLEPMDVHEDLFRVMASEGRVAHHLHLPVQSGSDRVLDRMGRRYSRCEYAELVNRARHHMPDLGLSTDIMVGFPGEKEEDHRETLALIRDIGFSRIHVFSFSPRPGTRAARLQGVVSPELKRRRRDELLELARACGLQFHRQQVGGTARVLLEKRVGAEQVPFATAAGTLFHGYSGSYVPTWVVGARPDDEGSLQDVRMVDAAEEGCLASMRRGTG